MKSTVVAVVNGGALALNANWMHRMLAADAAAAADPLSLNFITPIVNVGLIGVILLMVLLKKGFVPEWTLRDAEARHERERQALMADNSELKEAVRAGTTLYHEQVIPAFTRSIDVNREYNELLRKQARQDSVR